jgi:cell division protein FtsA
VIGERNESGILEITGVGMSPSTGLRKGVVVNIEATLRSVAAAIEAAEMMSGQDVHSCWTGIGGSHIDGINSRGVVAVTGKNGEIYATTIANTDGSFTCPLPSVRMGYIYIRAKAPGKGWNTQEDWLFL